MKQVQKKPLAITLAIIIAAGIWLWVDRANHTHQVSHAIQEAAPPTPHELTGLSEAQANAVIAAMSIVFRSFDFGGIGQRYPEKAPPEIAALAGGQCDSTVEAFRRLLKDVVQVVNLDFVTPNGSAVAGHTIGYIETPTGHILADTTFGLLFVHTGRLTPGAAFRNHAYRIYVIGKTPEAYAETIGSPLTYYGQADQPRASFALPKDALTVITEIMKIGEGLRIGRVDGSHQDIVPILGSYHAALGNYYRPALKVFRFKGKAQRQYLVTFTLGKPHTNPVELNIDVTRRNGTIATNLTAKLDNERDIFILDIKAPSDIFELRFSRDGMGARFIDAIHIIPIDNKQASAAPIG